MIRVLIAEDHHLVREGIRALLERAHDIEVVGQAQDGQEAVEQAQRLKPDVIIMDWSMPRLNGNQATEQIRLQHLRAQIVILSMYSDEAIVRQALRSGAKGYLLKRSVAEELPLAVRAVSRGEMYLSSTISAPLIADIIGKPRDEQDQSSFEQLSPRESQVLKLVAEGNTNLAIGQIMKISIKTVEKHRMHLMSKLNVHDTAGLVRMAIKHRLITVED